MDKIKWQTQEQIDKFLKRLDKLPICDDDLYSLPSEITAKQDKIELQHLIQVKIMSTNDGKKDR